MQFAATKRCSNKYRIAAASRGEGADNMHAHPEGKRRHGSSPEPLLADPAPPWAPRVSLVVPEAHVANVLIVGGAVQLAHLLLFKSVL